MLIMGFIVRDPDWICTTFPALNALVRQRGWSDNAAKLLGARTSTRRDLESTQSVAFDDALNKA
jgi:hypothetical protein